MPLPPGETTGPTPGPRHRRRPGNARRPGLSGGRDAWRTPPGLAAFGNVGLWKYAR
jgi:hypothetical protein